MFSLEPNQLKPTKESLNETETISLEEIVISEDEGSVLSQMCSSTIKFNGDEKGTILHGCLLVEFSRFWQLKN